MPNAVEGGQNSQQLPLHCSTSAGTEAWQLQVQIQNNDTSPWLILRWHSPLDAWFSEFLQVSQNGQKLLYQGAKAKRGEPSEEDLLLLAPGETHTEWLDLTQAYQLVMVPALVQFSPIAVMPHKPGQQMRWQATQQQWLLCPELQLLPKSDSR
ncbi:hypothetical protein [Rheinheimera sp. 4Y26]|uniref:hypothetical protein n=1 Tax=Rheinheimera sp. 4Y26 TaxID=2977811 RepID=UPI0021B0ABE6|nr:hypothetical protein [Rheinheimera sp. 4Y26]MCT6698143.1 hypothetical protein [Rheinheimera sp. 4Y26]